MDRRELLRAAGVAAAAAAGGLAAGSVEPVHLGLPARFTPLSRADRERAERVDSGAVARLGQHRVIWSVPPTGDLAASIALTFDDGPDPEFTPRVLDALAAAGVSATFNVMGFNALAHPELLRRAVAAGHEIGNHTWTHEDLAYQPEAQIREQLVRGRDAIEAVTQVPLRFLRPPRGELPGAALRLAGELGYDVLMWSVTRGPARPGPEESRAVGDYVSATVRAGDVLGLHDGIGRGTFDRHASFARALIARREAEVRALPALLAGIAARGLAVTTASALVDGRQRSRPSSQRDERRHRAG